MIHWGEKGYVKIPLEIYEELSAGNDSLSAWIKMEKFKTALKFEMEANIDLVRQVTDKGYAPDLTDVEIETIGKDPFLIAHALADAKNRVIVTIERSRPSAQRQNRKLPDVAREFNVKTLTAFKFGHELGFSTDWHRR